MPKAPSEPYKIFFETLGSKTRWDIVHFLKRRGIMSATAIAKALQLEQSLTSHNLRRLEVCGFVNVERRGKERLYSLNRETIKPLLKLMDIHITKFCAKCR